MSENLIVIGKKNDNVVFVCTIDSETKFADVEKMIENELKPNNPEVEFEIICDKILYDISKYFLLYEYNMYNNNLSQWKALNEDLGIIESNISRIRETITNALKTE